MLHMPRRVRVQQVRVLSLHHPTMTVSGITEVGPSFSYLAKLVQPVDAPLPYYYLSFM
jgi:hypothetical protein